MRRKRRPMINWRDYVDPSAPCRQRTQLSTHDGDCIRCFAITGEACRLPSDFRAAADFLEETK